MDDPLAELARRYLAGHAPASTVDFAAWSGLPVTSAKRAFATIAGELADLGTVGGRVAVPRELDLDPGGGRVVRLLGHFDPYLLG